MVKIECGGAAAKIAPSVGGIVTAHVGGLVLPGSAGALWSLSMHAAGHKGAEAIMYVMLGAALALPVQGPDTRIRVTREMRRTPVAVVVSPEQMYLYEHYAIAGARSGLLRRAFFSAAEAEAWLRREVWLSARNASPRARSTLDRERMPQGTPGSLPAPAHPAAQPRPAPES